MDKVPRKVGSLAVIFHKVLQEGDDVEARSEVGVLLGDVTLNSPQMIVVGKTVEMNENLDAMVDDRVIDLFSKYITGIIIAQLIAN